MLDAEVLEGVLGTDDPEGKSKEIEISSAAWAGTETPRSSWSSVSAS